MQIITNTINMIMKPINYILLNHLYKIMFVVVFGFGVWYLWKWWNGELE
jgi:hypothetical protein